MYTQPTFTEATDALASRLNDISFVRWGQAELQGYLREALRTWNTWTAHFRAQSSFVATMAEPFYDLPTVIPTLREQTVASWELVADLQYALLEPAAPPGTWTGTDQFTLDQLTSAITRRRDQFLRETGAVLTRTITNYPSPPVTGRIDLDESVQIVRRAAWRTTATGILYPLLVTDEWAGTHYQPTWGQSPLAPSAYSVTVVPPLTLQLMPPASGDGDLDLVSINSGTAVDPLVDTLLGIPNDYVWVVKYGALADLLSGDGLALDALRRDYCEQRWRQGLEQARSAPVVLNAQIGDNTTSPPTPVPCRVASLSEADRYTPTWQLVPSIPNTVLIAGQTLLALNPPPGGFGGPYTVYLDVVQNAPIPLIGTDVLQISKDVYDAILDLAQHCALFKEGVGQLQAAEGLFDRAARAAGITLRLQQASQPDRAPTVGQTQQDRRAVAEQRAPVLQGAEVD